MNIDRALSAPRGLSLSDDKVGIFAGDDDPRLIDEGVPITSTYHRTNGELWQKIGPNAEDWLIIKPGYKSGNIPLELAEGGEAGLQIEDMTFSVELATGDIGQIN